MAQAYVRRTARGKAAVAPVAVEPQHGTLRNAVGEVVRPPRCLSACHRVQTASLHLRRSAEAVALRSASALRGRVALPQAL